MLLLTVVIGAILAGTTVTQEGTCNSCNCQLSNTEAIARLVRDTVANSTRASTGATYVRWGKSSCPNSPGTQLVYQGNAGGTFWSVQGSGADKLCMPTDPDYLPSTSGLGAQLPASPVIVGVEYQYMVGPNSNVYDHNAPCAVCFATSRAAMVMIPGKTQCPARWTREYYGYLTSERASHPGRSVFNCVDVDPDVIGGTQADTNGALFYYVLSSCNGLTCPPYEADRALSCVVCTK